MKISLILGWHKVRVYVFVANIFVQHNQKCCTLTRITKNPIFLISSISYSHTDHHTGKDGHEPHFYSLCYDPQLSAFKSTSRPQSYVAARSLLHCLNNQVRHKHHLS